MNRERDCLLCGRVFHCHRKYVSQWTNKYCSDECKRRAIAISKTQPEMQRFLSYIDKTESGCWEWKAHRNKRGYGRIYLRGRYTSAHRASWMLHRGMIQEGLFVLHRCDNPPCVNPDHLFLGTHQENMADMAQKGRARAWREEDNPRAKLSLDQVRSILIDLRSGAELARQYGVCKETIYAVRKRRNWRDVA